MIRTSCQLPSCLAWLAATWPIVVAATDNGAVAFPPGGEDFAAAQMPPPGVYGELQLNRYGATTLRNDAGDALPVGFDLAVRAATAKLAWTRAVDVLGADRAGVLVVLPWLDIDLAVASQRDRRRGFGDLVLGNGLHWSWPTVDMVNAIDLVFPTGSYDAQRLANPGQNHGIVRAVHMLTWLPTATTEVSYRLNLDWNARNSDTDYQSGVLANFNYALGYKPAPGLTVGIAGYLYRQVSDDTQAGQDIGRRLRVYGLGLAAKWFVPSGQFVAAKWYRESGNRNGPEGSVAWLYGGTRF